MKIVLVAAVFLTTGCGGAVFEANLFDDDGGVEADAPPPTTLEADASTGRADTGPRPTGEGGMIKQLDAHVCVPPSPWLACGDAGFCDGLCVHMTGGWECTALPHPCAAVTCVDTYRCADLQAQACIAAQAKCEDVDGGVILDLTP